MVRGNVVRTVLAGVPIIVIRLTTGRFGSTGWFKYLNWWLATQVNHTLQVPPSHSRPSVSNDHPYSESLFRTLKYRPAMPVKPFECLLQARRWVTDLVHWYNDEHRHSAIGFVTPNQRHAGQDKVLLKERSAVYELAR